MEIKLERKFGVMNEIDKPGGYAEFGKPLVPTETLETANLISSELGYGFHAPVIDLDVPHKLVPSTTEGHSHLYIDVPMGWEQYSKLLRVLAECGIIEQGYCDASLARHASYVRKPGHKKVLGGATL